MTRKTPLRSNNSLKRSGWLRGASKKRSKEYGQYNKVKNAYLALHPKCERCKNKASHDIHHKAGRNGQWLTRYEYFAALCRQCHDWIHSNGKEARKQGWVIDVLHLYRGLDKVDSSASEDPTPSSSGQ
jgi:5-methylcytosine-specific restriction endonuclease McrA